MKCKSGPRVSIRVRGLPHKRKERFRPRRQRGARDADALSPRMGDTYTLALVAPSIFRGDRNPTGSAVGSSVPTPARGARRIPALPERRPPRPPRGFEREDEGFHLGDERLVVELDDIADSPGLELRVRLRQDHRPEHLLAALRLFLVLMGDVGELHQSPTSNPPLFTLHTPYVAHNKIWSR